MGFRTLAIQKSSSEVWSLLATVRSEFGKFGGLLEGVKKKLEQASNQIDDVVRKSRTIEKRLNRVEELPSHPEPLLPDLLPGDEMKKRNNRPVAVCRVSQSETSTGPRPTSTRL
jgi:DNA recombination protein RmuC